MWTYHLGTTCSNHISCLSFARRADTPTFLPLLRDRLPLHALVPPYSTTGVARANPDLTLEEERTDGPNRIALFAGWFLGWFWLAGAGLL